MEITTTYHGGPVSCDLFLLPSQPHLLPHCHHQVSKIVPSLPHFMLRGVSSAPRLSTSLSPSTPQGDSFLVMQASPWSVTPDLLTPTKWLFFLLSFHRGSYLAETRSQCTINVFSLKNYKNSGRCKGLCKSQTLLCLLTYFSYSLFLGSSLRDSHSSVWLEDLALCLSHNRW